MLSLPSCHFSTFKPLLPQQRHQQHKLLSVKMPHQYKNKQLSLLTKSQLQSQLQSQPITITRRFFSTEGGQPTDPQLPPHMQMISRGGKRALVIAGIAQLIYGMFKFSLLTFVPWWFYKSFISLEHRVNAAQLQIDSLRRENALLREQLHYTTHDIFDVRQSLKLPPPTPAPPLQAAHYHPSPPIVTSTIFTPLNDIFQPQPQHPVNGYDANNNPWAQPLQPYVDQQQNRTP